MAATATTLTQNNDLIMNLDARYQDEFIARLASNDSGAYPKKELTPKVIEARAGSNRSGEKEKRVAMLPLYGYLSHRDEGWGMPTELFAKWFDAYLNDNGIGAIVIDVDSPGGTVLGLQSTANKIYAARGKKPIISVVNDLMASAAYFIGSAADEIVADPDSLTGSIGTIGVHMDYSKYLDEFGVKPTIIKAGEFKAEGNPYEPLGEEAEEDWQKMVDAYYSTFVAAVARNRDVSIDKVLRDFGQGRILKAKKALAVGMIDRIGTLESVLRNPTLKTSKALTRQQTQAQYSKSQRLCNEAKLENCRDGIKPETAAKLKNILSIMKAKKSSDLSQREKNQLNFEILKVRSILMECNVPGSTTKDSIEKRLHFHGHNTTKKIVLEVLGKLPANVRDYTLNECQFAGVGKAAIGLAIPHTSRRVVVLDETRSVAEVKSTAAHEVAHIWLRHTDSHCDLSPAQREQDADDKAREWGF